MIILYPNILKVHDRGPVYAETLLASGYPFEPYNTYSNLIFLLIIIYWIFKTKLKYQKFPLIIASLPFLFIGWIGGTIYHATRSADLWLFMDFIPIIILTIAAALMFWKLLLGNIYYAVMFCFFFMIVPRFIIKMLNIHGNLLISISYAATVLSIILPAYFVSSKRSYTGIKSLLAAVLFFLIAISFRTYDLKIIEYLPHGSHFLWHIAGGISTHFLLMFIYQINLYTVKNSK